MLTRWLYTVGLFLLAGWFCGRFVDSILGQVSHDYIYTAGMFTGLGVRWGVALGTLVGAGVLHVRAVHRIPPATWMLAFIVALCVVPLLAGGWGGIGGFMAKFVEGHEAFALVPSARVAFCRGIIRGAGAGAILGSFLFFGLIMAIGRRIESRDETTGQTDVG